ncbi:hypothetical protein EX30DRAFT_341511 [Ascodesmis nigricans]|uniref:Uncharacterized protein n=1 Tax=Ascodesmis nigricans TaxID=341454 RepID=A0A4S2MVI0_9PEZI|nr:hypothetical protein EX30DRAFT_341511 [Ascodesmis nigricans]
MPRLPSSETVCPNHRDRLGEGSHILTRLEDLKPAKPPPAKRTSLTPHRPHAPHATIVIRPPLSLAPIPAAAAPPPPPQSSRPILTSPMWCASSGLPGLILRCEATRGELSSSRLC